MARILLLTGTPGVGKTTLMGSLLAALRERIDTIFLPRPIVLLDSLPRNSTGKLPRETLQALAEEHPRKGSAHAR